MLTERTTRASFVLTLTRLRSEAATTWLIVAAIGLLALLPRCLQLADFMTWDEAYHWIGRIHRFSDALVAGDWGKTNQTGHPGVTIMWLGSLGRLLGSLVGIRDTLPEGNSITYLALLRLPIAIVNSAAIVLGYFLLRRLVRPAVATLAAIFWATSPFLIAFDRLLHLDGTLTSCMLLSVLTLLVAIDTRHRRAHPQRAWHELVIGRWWLVASGVCAGLALLTKSPALILLPLCGLLLLTAPAASLRQRLVQTTLSYGAWLAVIGVVGVLCWPAVWVAPIKATRAVVREIKYNGSEPHASGNYFLGAKVEDPGLLFYPVMIALRSTPATLLGLVLVPLTIRRRTDRRVLLQLGLFVALFGLVMSLEPKKFDRYILPIWPMLELFAAMGLVELWGIIARRFDIRRWRAAAWLLAIAPTLALNGWYHPYYQAYFNPVTGGGEVAQRVTLVGWGEGMEHIGAWLNARPDLKHGTVASWIGPTLAPFMSAPVLDLNKQPLDPHSRYGVRYIRLSQRNEDPSTQTYLQQTPPLYTLRLYGITYAEVYQLPRPFDQPLDVTFGDGLHLRGWSQTRIGSTLVITPSWDVQTRQRGGLRNVVQLLAPDGTIVAQTTSAIDDGMFHDWQVGQQFDAPLRLALPTNAPASDYRLFFGVQENTTSASIPLTRGHADQADIVLLAKNPVIK